jgi:GNAT superfamily N-acetyltransferase
MPVVLDESLLGRRVTVRYLRSERDGRPPLSDVVGVLVSLTGTTATVSGRHGPVTVPLSAIVAARPVAPDRREILALQRAAGLGWRPAETVELDGWLLRADRGWTGRANSALPLATPTRALPQLLAEVSTFYRDRGLPVQIQIPLPARGLLDTELATRCWTIERPTIVLTRPIGAGDIDTSIELAEAPSAEWLAAYHYRGGPLPDHAVALLTRHDCVRFASVTIAGQVIGIARGTVDDGWLGVTSVEVDPRHRRAGHASALMSALAYWAVGEQAHNCYLQVDVDNHGALALYQRLGFTEHHRYHYRIAPR